MDQTTYYARDEITHLDGTKIFQTPADRGHEDEVSAMVEAAWGCRVSRFGMLSPIDWFAERHGRVVGLLELKCRPHPSDQHATVFLNVRKWLALQLGAVGMGCPAIFVVRFADCVRWINLSAVDATNQRVAGCTRIVKSRSDIEPVIEVEISGMASIKLPTPQRGTTPEETERDA